MADSSSTAAATPTKSVPPPPLVPSQQQNPQQEATNSVANTVQDKSSIAQEPVEELGLLGEQLAIIRSNLVIVVAVCVTWLAQWTFGDISASFLLLIILALCRVINREMTRYKAICRLEVEKKLSFQTMIKDQETADWFNVILTRFWLIYEPVLSETIMLSVNPILEYYTPSFIDSIALSEFTLGTAAPFIRNARGYPKYDDDIIRFELDVDFQPRDSESLSVRKGERNSRIVLSTRIGRGMVAVEAPVLMKNIAFSATVTIEMKTMPGYPFIKLLSISFPELPNVQFSLKPLKGMDLMDVPGLSAFLNKLISDILAMMFVPPNIYTLDLDAMMNGTGYALESSIGVLMIHVYEAKELKNTDQLGGTSDPFVAVKLGGRLQAESQIITNNLNPYWDESFYILVQSFNDVLELTVHDKDVLKNRTMGVFKCSLRELGLNSDSGDAAEKKQQKLEDLWRPLTSAAGSTTKSRGQIRFDLAFYPVVAAPKPGVTPASAPEVPNANSSTYGVLHVTIHQAKELDESKSIVGQYNPYVEVLHNERLAHKTKIKKRTNNPSFEDNFELFIRNIEKDRIRFTVFDQRDLTTSRPEIGDCEVLVADVVKMAQSADPTKKIEWWTLRNVKSGKLRLSFRFVPVHIDHDVPDDDATGQQSLAPAVGVIRVNVIEADNLKNQQAVGISDPYVRVIYAGKCRARTAVQPATLQPVWNEPHYILVHQMKGRLGFELFDYNNLQKDKFMGRCDTDLKWILAECANKVVKSEMPVYLDAQKKQYGTLTVELSYYALDDENRGVGWDRLAASGSPRVRHLGSAGVLSSNSTPALFGPAEPVKSPEEHKSDQSIEEMVSGVLHLELEEIMLEDAAMMEEGYDGKRKLPSPYLEFLDSSGCVHSNYAAELSGTNIFDKSEEKSTVLNPSSLSLGNFVRRKSSREMSAIRNSLSAADEDALRLRQTLVLLYRTVNLRKSNSGPLVAKLELFIKDLHSAKMLVICKDAKTDDAGSEGVTTKQHRILGKTQLSMKDLLDEPTEWFRLFPVRVNANCLLTGRFKMKASFTPVKIDEDLLVNEQELLATSSGKVEMCLVEANTLPSVDSGGTSDPYCCVWLNNERVHKTKVLKKNMNPRWNDSFTVNIANRASSRLFFEIKDWNQFEDHKTLGYVVLDCARMVVDERAEFKYQLADEDGNDVVDKHGHKSTLQLRTHFIPEETEAFRKRRLARRKKIDGGSHTGSAQDLAAAVVAAKRLMTNVKRQSLNRTHRNNNFTAIASAASDHQNTSDSGREQADRKSSGASATQIIQIPSSITETDIEGSMLNLPAGIISGILNIIIYEAKNCPAKSDVYVKFLKGTGRMRRTSSSKSISRLSLSMKHGDEGAFIHRTGQLRVPVDTARVIWNDKVTIPFSVHETEDLEYRIQLKSHNLIGPATELATFSLNIWQIIKARETAGSFDFWLLPKTEGGADGENRNQTAFDQRNENISLHLLLDYQPIIEQQQPQ